MGCTERDEAPRTRRSFWVKDPESRLPDRHEYSVLAVITRLRLDPKKTQAALALNSADFNGTAHRDVKLFVLHGKVTQLQRAHND
jgi:hypothetical protein